MILVRLTGLTAQSKVIVQLACPSVRPDRPDRKSLASAFSSIVAHPSIPPISASRAARAFCRASENRWTQGHPHREATAFHASRASSQARRALPFPPEGPPAGAGANKSPVRPARISGPTPKAVPLLPLVCSAWWPPGHSASCRSKPAGMVVPDPTPPSGSGCGITWTSTLSLIPGGAAFEG